MPPRTSRPAFPGHLVTAVLVSHDGARWLPESMAALAAQTRAPQRVVAVDTGSTDGSRDLLAASLGATTVVGLTAGTGLGAAVQAGLDAFAGAAPVAGPRGQETVEWVWVLHDDCVPDPTALQELLARAVDSPSASVVGPKVVSLDRRRLLEVGVTVDGSGHRETGLEPREVDQGQHDGVGDVLAVGTAGMLVRREVWDRVGGLDRAWPLYGDDIDFGWRVNLAGGRVLVAPGAVVRHAAGLATGSRHPDAVRGRAAVAQRRHGMQVMLANTSALLVPVYLVRFVLETLVRAVGTLALLRRPVGAYAEVAAVTGLLVRPGLVIGARRRRRSLRDRPHRDIRPLLAPPSLRLRRAGDLLAAAVAGRAAVDERMRRRGVPVETGPVAEEAESFDVGGDGLRGLLRRPGLLFALGLVALTLIADRGVLGGVLHGGRLLPAPAGAGDLWATYVNGWHAVGLGGAAPAPPWIAEVALLASILLGKAWLAVDVLVLGGVALAGVTAYLALGALTRNAALRCWAALIYAVLPAVTGAVSGGRIDVVGAAVLLPLAARAVATATGTDPRRAGWHRAVGAGIVLALAAGFAPLVWLLAVPGAVAVVVLVRTGGGAGAFFARLGAAVVVLAVPLLVLLPWSWHVATNPALLVTGAGLPDVLLAQVPQPVQQILLLHPGGPAQPPLWVLGPLVVAAIAGLARSRHAAAARVGFTLFATGAAAALVASRQTGAVAGIPQARYWTGTALLVAGLGAVVCGVVAAQGAKASLSRHAFGWRQPFALLVAGAVVAGTGVAAVAWLVRGVADPLTAARHELLPVFAAAEASLPTSPRVLMVRSDGTVVRYALLRTPEGPVLGDADIRPIDPDAAVAAGDRALAQTVRDLGAGRQQAVGELGEFGVTLLVAPADDAAALATLSRVEGLSRLSSTGAAVYRGRVPTGELVVVPPHESAVVAGGDALPPDAVPVPVPARDGAAQAAIPAGPAGRLLVLAEPADGHWRASVAGHALPQARAYGWAQAWQLPPEGGQVTVARTGDDRERWLWAELGIAVVVLLFALPTRRRAPAEERSR